MSTAGEDATAPPGQTSFVADSSKERQVRRAAACGAVPGYRRGPRLHPTGPIRGAICVPTSGSFHPTITFPIRPKHDPIASANALLDWAIKNNPARLRSLGYRGTPRPNRRPPPSVASAPSAIWASPRHPRTNTNTRPDRRPDARGISGSASYEDRTRRLAPIQRRNMELLFSCWRNANPSLV